MQCMSVFIKKVNTLNIYVKYDKIAYEGKW